MHEARRVEQDVGLAVGLGEALCEGVDVSCVANVEPCRRCSDTFPGETREALFIDVGGYDHGTLARECDGAGPSNARRRCGDECAFALQAV
jgi:hypothetical protein